MKSIRVSLQLSALAAVLSTGAWASNSFAWCWSATQMPSDTLYFSAIFVTSASTSELDAAFGEYVFKTYKNPNTTGPGQCHIGYKTRADAEKGVDVARAEASFEKQRVVDTNWRYKSKESEVGAKQLYFFCDVGYGEAPNYGLLVSRIFTHAEVTYETTTQDWTHQFMTSFASYHPLTGMGAACTGTGIDTKEHAEKLRQQIIDNSAPVAKLPIVEVEFSPK